MEISLAGLIGAVLGTIASAVIYGPLVGAIESRLRSRQQSEPADRMALAQEIALLRRGVLAADILLCAGLGYWIGQMIGG
jgi:uncharacterized protein YqgC (DUF456 family)